MIEGDLIGGLADIEEQLRAGNVGQQKLAESLLLILQAIRSMPPPQVTFNEAPEPPEPAANVSVPVTVQPAAVTVLQAPAPEFDWEHTHIYDEIGRMVRTVSKRVNRSKP